MIYRCCIFIIVLTGMLCGCKAGFAPDEDSPKDVDPSFHGYYDGAIWVLTLDDDRDETDFRLSRRTNARGAIGSEPLILNGKYSRRAGGFTVLTVDEKVKGDGGFAIGDSITILEVSDDLVLIAPFSTNVTRFGALVTRTRDTCPSANTTSNWVNYLPAPSDADGDVGTLAYNSESDVTTLTSRVGLDLNFPVTTEDATLAGTACAEGIAASTNEIHFHGKNNNAVIVTGLGTNTSTRLRLATAIKEIGSASAFDGEYIGLYHNDGDISQRQFAYIAGSCTSGLCNFDRVDSGGNIITAPSNSMQLDLQNADNIDPDTIGLGWATGTLFESNDTVNSNAQRVACTVDVDAAGADEVEDIRYLSCIGTSVTDVEKQFTLFVLSK